jgi:hypothetical protein
MMPTTRRAKPPQLGDAMMELSESLEDSCITTMQTYPREVDTNCVNEAEMEGLGTMLGNVTLDKAVSSSPGNIRLLSLEDGAGATERMIKLANEFRSYPVTKDKFSTVDTVQLKLDVVRDSTYPVDKQGADVAFALNMIPSITSLQIELVPAREVHLAKVLADSIMADLSLPLLQSFTMGRCFPVTASKLFEFLGRHPHVVYVYLIRAVHHFC